MSTPYNGWATDISIQREATLGGAGSGAVYSLCGRVRFNQGVEFVGKDKTVNVWREQAKSFYSGKYYTGTIEIELGLNAVIEILLGIFFELESSESVAEGGAGGIVYGEFGPIFGEGGEVYGEPPSITSYVLRPLRLKGLKSCKIGLDFLSHSFLLEGVTIDSLRFDIRRNQVPKLNVTFKALTRESVSVPALADAASIDVRRAHHTSVAFTFDAVALSNITEGNFTFNSIKLPTKFSATKTPELFRVEPFTLSGQLVEYYSADAKLADAVTDQAEHSLIAILTDPAGSNRKIEIHWPKLNFSEGLPEAVNREDLISRASFSGLCDSAQTSDGPKLILVA